MTSFKCRECDNHWSEGPTRDHRTDQLCRSCLTHKLKVCHADAARALQGSTTGAYKSAIVSIFSTTNEVLAGKSTGPFQALDTGPFQNRVHPWVTECFGAEIAADKTERNHRFLEEALELVQSLGCTRGEAIHLVNYVYNRPLGDPPQEVGGVMLTLAALCSTQDMNMHDAGETELARVWTKIEQIRAKQAAKPKHSSLPA